MLVGHDPTISGLTILHLDHLDLSTTGTASGIRTHTVLGLSQFPLPIGVQQYGANRGIRTHYLQFTKLLHSHMCLEGLAERRGFEPRYCGLEPQVLAVERPPYVGGPAGNRTLT